MTKTAKTVLTAAVLAGTVSLSGGCMLWEERDAAMYGSEPDHIPASSESAAGSETVPEAPTEAAPTAPPAEYTDRVIASAEEAEGLSDGEVVYLAQREFTDLYAAVPDWYEPDYIGGDLYSQSEDGFPEAELVIRDVTPDDGNYAAAGEDYIMKNAERCTDCNGSTGQKTTVEDMEFLGENELWAEFRVHSSYYRVWYSNDELQEMNRSSVQRWLFLKPLAGSELTAEKVRDRMDMILGNSGLSGGMIFRELNETETAYEYVYYTATMIWGDFDVDNSAVLEKTVIDVKKSDPDRFSDTGEVIRTVALPGTAQPWPE